MSNTYSRMGIAYRRAAFNKIDIAKIIKDEIDNEILENLRRLMDEEDSKLGEQERESL